MSILDKLLKKRGVTIDQLDNEEKQTFENWRKILSKDSLTIEDIKQFCQSQISIIEGKWTDMERDNAKKAELIPYHTVYKMLLTAIDSPKSTRENLEAQLNQLLNN